MKKKQIVNCTIIHDKVVALVSSKMLKAQDSLGLAELYKMFSDPTRIKILWALNLHEMCVCDIASVLNMTKSAISHQLKFLRLSNLIKSRREGKVIFYSLADNHVKIILKTGLEHINE